MQPHKPVLKQLSRKNIHKMPAGFCIELEQQINERVLLETTALSRRNEYWAEFSATLLIIILAVFIGCDAFPYKADFSDNSTANTAVYSMPDQNHFATSF